MLKKKGDTDGLDKQSEKLLKDFFKKNNSLDKRWRSLHAFREAKADAPHELAKFYADNFRSIPKAAKAMRWTAPSSNPGVPQSNG